MEAGQESFISHLVELRDRLIRALVVVLLIFLGLVNWARDIYTLLAAPMLASLPAGGQMIATDVAGAFFVPMKVTMMVAFLLALPYVLYQAWAFVAPGLYVHEKKLALPLLVASVLLFFIGMGFAYFIVFPTVFNFINAFAPEGVAVMTDIDKYLSFVLSTFLAFGVTFEIPVIVIVLVRVGLVSVEKLKEIRPYVIVGAFILGAIFTPPDVLSQFMLAVPMWLLYEFGIVMAQLIGKSPGAEGWRATDDAA
jgi:sec-independent protein translocase protein TatC